MTIITPRFAVISIAIALPFSTPAFAHVSIDNAESKGGSFKAVFNIPHGCEKSPTTEVRITIPEGIIGVKPMPKPGWTLATTKGAYAKTYDYFHGMKVSEGVKSVTWSGGKLLNEHVDEFVLALFVTSDFEPGSTVYFPVEQICETGSLAWSQIPAAGQDAHDLKSPAPALRIVARTADAAPAPQAVEAEALKIERAWLRATPGGATVGAGYVMITNTGTKPDRLIGGDFAIAGRVEVHEMTMTGGVMKMRALADGLEIKPGETVTLAPGGTHLMLLDLKEPIAPGAPVRAELTFERAGKVAVDFAIAPVGGSAPAAEGHGHH